MKYNIYLNLLIIYFLQLIHLRNSIGTYRLGMTFVLEQLCCILCTCDDIKRDRILCNIFASSPHPSAYTILHGNVFANPTTNARNSLTLHCSEHAAISSLTNVFVYSIVFMTFFFWWASVSWANVWIIKVWQLYSVKHRTRATEAGTQQPCWFMRGKFCTVSTRGIHLNG